MWQIDAAAKVLRAAEAIAPEAVAALEGETVNLLSAAAEKTGTSRIFNLAAARFPTIFSEQKVVTEECAAPFVAGSAEQSFPGIPTVRGEMSMSMDNFTGLENKFSGFLGQLKQANSVGNRAQRALFSRSLASFDEGVVPALRRAGIGVERVSDPRDVRAHTFLDMPLNSRFNTVHDLNTIGGMRSYLNSGAGDALLRSATADGWLSDGAMQTALRGPDEQVLNYRIRHGMFGAALRKPDIEVVADEGLLSTLRAGGTVKVPLHLHVALPEDSLNMTLRERAFANFEEVAHTFQTLNKGPLSRTGENIASGIASAHPDIVGLGMKVGDFNTLRDENDIVGILRESGIKPPAFMMSRYARREIALLGI
jgi:hypothetical protein